MYFQLHSSAQHLTIRIYTMSALKSSKSWQCTFKLWICVAIVTGNHKLRSKNYISEDAVTLDVNTFYGAQSYQH